MSAPRSHEFKDELISKPDYRFFNSAITEFNIITGKEALQTILNDYDWSKINEKFFLKAVKMCINGEGHFSVPTIGEILKTFDYHSLKSKILVLVADKGPHLFADWTHYFDLLDAIPASQLSNDEKIYLTRNFYNGLINVYEKREIAKYIELAIQLKQEAGYSAFIALFKHPVVDKDHSSLKNYIKICELVTKIDNVDAEEIIRTHYPKLKALVKALEDIEITERQKIQLDQKSEDIVDRWSKKDDFVKFPLSQEEINQLKKDYQAFQSEAKTLTITASDLANEAKKTVAEMSSNPSKIFRLLAIVNEAIRYEFKNYPYPEQILSVLALLRIPLSMKGRVAKIRTGEGKSRTIAMLAVLKALQGRCVDIITANRYLAIRDQSQFSAFFQSLGISSSSVCSDFPEKKDFDHLINYATHHDIEFSILRDETFSAENRYTTVNNKLVRRPFHDVIVDEVDVMLLDAQRNSARIAIENPKSLSWVYHPILQFIKNKIGKDNLTTDEIKSARKTLLTPEVAEQIKIDLAKFAPQKDAEKNFDNTKIIHWIHAAIQALYVLQLDKDYIIKKISKQGKKEKPQVIIIDAETTGRSNGENSRLSHGLHEMLEIIHHIPYGEETLTCAAISHLALLNRYEFISGLTGTVGTIVEREEILETYRVGSIDVPSRFASRRIQESTLYFQEEKEYASAIVAEVKKIKSQGRPVLLIVETIKESNQFADLLREQKIAVHVVNEKQQEDEDYLISRAGYPGVVTVATYTAGRGTDIILPEESLKNGGLHVIFGNFPTNERAEEQGFGRAGRQGQIGSCRMMICEKNPYIQQLLKSNSLDDKIITLADDKDFMSKLREFRYKEVERLSKNRRIYCQVDVIHHQILQEFWFLLQIYRDEMNKVDLNAIAEKCREIKPSRKFIVVDGLPLTLKSYHDKAQLMIMEQLKGESVDWLAYIKSGYAQYCNETIENILLTWATFFTNLEDMRIISPELYKKIAFKKMHQFINDELLKLHNPTGEFLNFLCRILENNSVEILMHNKSVEKAPFFLEWEKRIKNIFEDRSIPTSVVVSGITLYQKKDNSAVDSKPLKHLEKQLSYQ